MAADIDLKKNSGFIIERILMYGNEDDFRWARDFYGEEKIKELLCQSKKIDKKSLYFWRQFFNLTNKECTQNQ